MVIDQSRQNGWYGALSRCALTLTPRKRLAFSIDLPSDVSLGCQHSIPDASIRFCSRQNKLCLVLQVRDYHLCNTNHMSSLWRGLLSIGSIDNRWFSKRARFIPCFRNVWDSPSLRADVCCCLCLEGRIYLKIRCDDETIKQSEKRLWLDVTCVQKFNMYYRSIGRFWNFTP